MRARRFTALAPFALTAAAACNAILGNEPRSLYPGDAAADVTTVDASPSAEASADAPGADVRDAAVADTAPPADVAPESPTPPGDGNCGDTTSDGLNCGSCGHSCLGDACVGSLCQPTVLVSGIDPPQGLVVDTSTVWWVTDTFVFSCGKGGCGGTGVSQSTPFLGSPTSLAQMGDQLFYSTLAPLDDGGTAGDIETWTKFSTAHPTVIATGGTQPRGLIPCGGYLCWYDTPSGSTLGTVYSCATSGCASPTVVTTDQGIDGIASDGLNVVITTNLSVDICPLPGCAAPTQLAPATNAESPACGGGQVVWSDQQNSVMTCTPPGCSSKPLAKNVTWPRGLVVDGTTVYFTTFEANGSLYATSLLGGVAPRPIAKGLPLPDLIAVDATRIYFTTWGQIGPSNVGQIAWVAK
jgi:hypothetical protein